MAELVAELNRLAGTSGLEAAGAANVWAGSSGLELVGALNDKAGTAGLELGGVISLLAVQHGGNPNLSLQGALASITSLSTGEALLTEASDELQTEAGAGLVRD